MRDRLVRGALAGVIAGLWIMVIHAGSFYLLHFAKNRWADAISQLMWGHPVRSTIEAVIALAMLFVLLGAQGYLYTWLIIPQPAAGNYIIRGIGFGFIMLVILYSIGTLFKVPYYYNIAWQTAITNFVAILGWGTILGYLTRHWDYAVNDLGDRPDDGEDTGERRVVRAHRIDGDDEH